MKQEKLCNMCGGSCLKTFDSKETEDSHYDFYGLAAKFSSGYLSTERIDDGITYQFNMCESCLEDLFDRFKIPVDMEYYLLMIDGMDKPQWKKK